MKHLFTPFKMKWKKGKGTYRKEKDKINRKPKQASRAGTIDVQNL